MKGIEKITSDYHERLIGDQSKIEDIPFHIEVGKLTDEGTIEQSAKAFHIEFVAAFPLTVSVETTVLSYINQRYRQLMISLRALVATVSYDYKIFIKPKLAFQARELSDGKNSARMFKNAIGDNLSHHAHEIYYIPYGDIEYFLKMDNNHATDTISMEAMMLFFDPIR